MDCKSTFTKRGKRNAFTLVELLIAVGLGGLLIAAVLSLFYYALRSFAAMDNYLELDLQSQQTVDKMSKEVRQARSVTTYGTNTLTFLDVNSNSVTYIFDAATSSLLRTSGGATNIWLKGCDSGQFSIYQRTPISNTFDCYTPAYVTNTKLMLVSWCCSRKILGAKVNTETVQSAKIVIRND